MYMSHEHAGHPYTLLKNFGEGPSTPSIAEFHIAVTNEVDYTFLENITLGDFDDACRETEVHLTARCAGLLEVQGSGSDPFLRRVEYLHRTAGDFLAKDDHWSKISTQASAIEFDPNVAMMKASVLCLLTRQPTLESDLLIDGSRRGPRTRDQTLFLAAMTFSYHAAKQTESHGLQEALLDIMDTSMHSCYLNPQIPWPAQVTNYTWPATTFLEVATAFNLGHYVDKKITELSNTEKQSQVATSLLYYLLINTGSTATAPFPRPTSEMVSILISFGADPHLRRGGWTVWKHVLNVIQRISGQRSRRIECLELLAIMKVLASARSINEVSAKEQVSTRCTLVQDPLRFYSKETKEILQELESRMQPADMKALLEATGSTGSSIHI
jgi:hypothetical protein